MNWYCIHTRPSKEDEVEHYLSERLGLSTYAPRIIQEKLVRGMMTEVAGPLFPRYIFCQLDLLNQGQAVRQIPSVVDLVGCNGKPATVSASLLFQLRNWAHEGVDILNFQPGDMNGARVEISNSRPSVLPAGITRSNNARERVAALLAVLEFGAKPANSGAEIHGISK